MHDFFWWLRFFHILNPTIPSDAGFHTCKALPNTPSWPPDAAWAKLNNSVSGNLLKPLPPGAVCDEQLKVFNNATCAQVYNQYNSSLFHADDPVSVDWPNWQSDSCLPSSLAPCNLDQFPIYVVNASRPQHVKAGVDFARYHNIRLVVKGTGHDFLGRSTAPNSISIWTHHLRGLDFQSSFTPKGCKARYESALTIAAGEQMKAIYAAAGKHNRVIVGGFDPNVGIGGYITAGGHSPISSTYGLATDHVLEFEVVRPDGAIVTANECTHTDLFWAMKGGGGSTFGVLLSVTVRTQPVSAVAINLFALNSTSLSTDDFWSAVAYIHTQLADLNDKGLTGYTFLVPNPTSLHPGALMFAWECWILNASISDLDAVLAPLIHTLENSAYSSGIFVFSHTTHVDNMYTWWAKTSLPGAVGGNTQLGSRLLDRKALSQPVDFIKQKLKAALPPGGTLLGHLIAGKGVANAKAPGGPGAVLPAWRRAYLHLVVPIGYPYLSPRAQATQSALLTHNYTQALRDLAPDTGCYLNEADANEPDLGHAFWGNNYERLLRLKRSMDPKGVFWGKPCVGGGDWSLNAKGQLCRA